MGFVSALKLCWTIMRKRRSHTRSSKWSLLVSYSPEGLRDALSESFASTLIACRKPAEKADSHDITISVHLETPNEIHVCAHLVPRVRVFNRYERGQFGDFYRKAVMFDCRMKFLRGGMHERYGSLRDTCGVDVLAVDILRELDELPWEECSLFSPVNRSNVKPFDPLKECAA